MLTLEQKQRLSAILVKIKNSDTDEEQEDGIDSALILLGTFKEEIEKKICRKFWQKSQHFINEESQTNASL